jgi:energy-coupling factor transporter ATP-binding protein EcfA2
MLDEITAGLDPERRQEIVTLVHDLAQRIVTIVITHDETEFNQWATLTLTASASAVFPA